MNREARKAQKGEERLGEDTSPYLGSEWDPGGDGFSHSTKLMIKTIQQRQ